MKLFARCSVCGLYVGVGWWCIVKLEVLVLLHLCRYILPEGFRVAVGNDLLGLLELIDAKYLRYDGVKGAAVVFRGCVVVCPSSLLQGGCVG